MVKKVAGKCRALSSSPVDAIFMFFFPLQRAKETRWGDTSDLSVHYYFIGLHVGISHIGGYQSMGALTWQH